MFHKVVSIKTGSVTDEILSYLHQGSQTTSSILQASGLPSSPPWIQGRLLARLSPHLSRKEIRVALINVIITVSYVQALHHAAFIRSHSAFFCYFILLVCVLFLKYFE